MAQLPTGTVTFLFTDLEGSTRLWEEHPDAMRAALARHDEILREAVEKRGDHGWASETTDPVGARAALEESVALTRTGASDVMLSSSLGLLGKLRLGTGDANGAIAALHESVVHAYRDGDRRTFFSNLQFAITPLAELGEHELAALLHAATAPGATAPGELVPIVAPHQVPERDAAVESARGTLGNEEFDRILAIGRAMDYDQIAGHVLSELDRMIEERTNA